MTSNPTTPSETKIRGAFENWRIATHYPNDSMVYGALRHEAFNAGYQAARVEQPSAAVELAIRAYQYSPHSASDNYSLRGCMTDVVGVLLASQVGTNSDAENGKLRGAIAMMLATGIPLLELVGRENPNVQMIEDAIMAQADVFMQLRALLTPTSGGKRE